MEIIIFFYKDTKKKKNNNCMALIDMKCTSSIYTHRKTTLESFFHTKIINSQFLHQKKFRTIQ